MILNIAELFRKSLWLAVVVLTLSFSTAFSSCNSSDTASNEKVREIVERGTLLVGTTGDYRPLSFRESDGTYWGFCLEVAQQIARDLKVETEYVPTSWPTLTADVMAEPQKFDLAIGGITITDDRREIMLMSEGEEHYTFLESLPSSVKRNPHFFRRRLHYSDLPSRR